MQFNMKKGLCFALSIAFAGWAPVSLAMTDPCQHLEGTWTGTWQTYSNYTSKVRAEVKYRENEVSILATFYPVNGGASSTSLFTGVCTNGKLWLSYSGGYAIQGFISGNFIQLQNSSNTGMLNKE